VTKPSHALVATWYARLRATGFRDIEDGVRPGKLAWTFRGGSGADHGAVFVQWPQWDAHWDPRQGSVSKSGEKVDFDLPDDNEHRLADHPTAVYYRRLAQAAQALKGRQRKLILVASEDGAAEASRGLKMSRRTASHQVRRFAVATGLVREAHGS
jgi:hypothetical protein